MDLCSREDSALVGRDTCLLTTRRGEKEEEEPMTKEPSAAQQKVADLQEQIDAFRDL
ncbi:MAG TPA: hypothetical protein VHG30_10635 [Microvirga sp.]|nr:hypothetical protein [Microvirga sp.]